jgi:hypothetical protein
VTDYRKCKDVISDIAAIIEFALRGKQFTLPPFLSDLAQTRTGFNDTRAFLEIIQQYQKLGIPTGPMPDGSPNLFMLSTKGMIKGTEAERNKNSKTIGLLPALVITPAGVTLRQPYTSIPV